jgi:hypothetical protein
MIRKSRGRVSAQCAEQETLAVLGDAGRGNIGMQHFGKYMMTWHGVLLAAFLVQPDRPC